MLVDLGSCGWFSSHVLSRYGIHSLPSILIVNQTTRVRYYGPKDLSSFVRFYKRTTGLHQVGDVTEDQGRYSQSGHKVLHPWNGNSLKEILIREPYLVFSVMFLFLRGFLYFFPDIISHLISLWLVYLPHLNVAILGESRQFLGRVLHLVDIKRVWSKLKTCKTRNFHNGARSARVWASSLASVSLGFFLPYALDFFGLKLEGQIGPDGTGPVGFGSSCPQPGSRTPYPVGAWDRPIHEQAWTGRAGPDGPTKRRRIDHRNSASEEVEEGDESEAQEHRSYGEVLVGERLRGILEPGYLLLYAVIFADIYLVALYANAGHPIFWYGDMVKVFNGGLHQISWFQFLPHESDLNPLHDKSTKLEQKEAATLLVLSSHLQLQKEGFLSTWTNSFVGPWDPSQGLHNPNEKIKLWLFLPGRYSSVIESAQAAVSRLRVLASGIWLAPGDSEEVAVALSQALRNRIERGLTGLSYMRFGDVFSKYHPFSQSEELFRFLSITYLIQHGGICYCFFNTEGFVIMEKVLASCLEAATRENGKYSVLATGRLNLSIRVWKHIQKWFILRCDYGVIRNH
ncbi:RNA polymerase II transcription mediator [Actinidia rufa]|uniref:RNA polymerase II transcription mediator n=1 Tax=Actinidia rufa TaxID=165716 RepID=A0A7J0EBJ4_9ERIC|nr:RNA polymerase II transcription mediator [Actinidia rufa]